MKTSISVVAVQLMLMLMLSVGRYALAAEHSVACNTLPSAVQQKSKLILDGATVRGCIRDISKGRTTYELETVKNGYSKDITFDLDGNVLEIEEQIDFASLPAPVVAAIQREKGAGPPGKIESVTRAGTVISYETTVTRNGKPQGIAFRPDGSAMKPD
jgi:hypothetical protein